MSNYIPYIKKINFTNNILDVKFDLIKSNYENQPKFKLGYHYYTKQVREKMHLDEFKKRDFFLITSKFESIIPDYKEGLDNIISRKFNSKVLTRDFYKLWEMLVYFDLLNEKEVKTLSLSDNGGFLQCIYEFRNYYYSSKKDTYCYQTKNDKEISECLKGNIKNNKIKQVSMVSEENLNISDLLLTKNAVNKFIKDNNLSNIEFITSNGTNNNFNNNLESNMYNYFVGQILTAINIQKLNGSYILRIEDCFTDVTLKLLNIIGSCYKEVYICKPLFSRSFNNERYLICKNFNLNESNKKKIINKLELLLDDINELYKNNIYLFDFATSFKYDLNLENLFSEINSELTALEHLNINKIIEYKNGKNYFGDQYHKFRDHQIEANKWWESNFIKDDKKLLDNTRKLIKL
jgi:hypothetical protein